ncbi:MAG: PAS domain S-box protein [Anaerolineae bacterium]|nr:PAS domain S-box protein [Anaerolineae bacterium]
MSSLRVLWQKLTRPAAIDEEEARREHMTRVILVMIGVALLVPSGIIVAGWIAGVFAFQDIITMTVLGLALLGGWGLVGSGRWRLASYIPPAMFFLLAVAINWSSGLLTTATVIYTVAILLSAMLQGVRAQWVMVILSTAAYLASGLIHDDEPDIFVPAAIIVICSLVAIALLQWFSTRLLQRALTQARSANKRLEQEVVERRRTEAALRESTEKIRAMFESVTDGITFTDLQGVILEINEATVRLYGPECKKEEIIGKSAFEFIAESDRARALASLKETLNSGRSGVIEYKCSKQSGEVFDTELNAVLLKDEQGNPSGFVALTRDITERKRAEEALRKSEELFRGMADSIQDGLTIIEHGRVVYTNDRCCEITGRSKEEMVRLDSLAFAAPEERERLQAIAEQARRTGEQPAELEFWILRPDGARRCIHNRYTLKRWEDGPIDRYVVTTDITERKRIEEALRRERDLLARVMETSPAGIVVMDKDGQITFANSRAEQVLGLSKDQITQRAYNAPQWRIVNHLGRPFPNHELPFQRVAASGKPVYDVRHAIERAAGQRVLLTINAAPLFDEAGVMDGMVATVEDITDRTRAEKALQESEQQFRTLVANIPGAVFRCALDSDWTMYFISDAIEDITGYPASDFIQNRVRTYASAIHPDDRQWVEQTVREWVEKRQPYIIEYRILHTGGEVRWVYEKGQAIFGEDGELACIDGAIFDITEQRRAEQTIKRTQQQLQDIFDNIPAPMYVKDLAARYMMVNRRWRERSGMGNRDVIGKTILELFPHLGYTDRWDPQEAQVIASGEAMQFEEVGRTTGIIYLASKFLLRDADGKPYALCSNSIDITERKRAEEERSLLIARIQEHARQVQQIIETVPEGVLLLDMTRQIVLANPAADQYLAALNHAGMGNILTHLGDQPLDALLTSPPEGLWHEVKTAAGGGSPQTFEIIARPIETGPPTGGWLLVIRDVTQEREAQKRIQQQNRLAAVGQLAAGIAHDFNNIVAVIVLYVQILLKTADLPPRATERLQTIVQQAHRATDLIEQILDFSRRSVMECKPLDLVPFLKEQVKLLRRTLPESIKFDLVYEPGEYMVSADLTRLQQAIMNLVINARDAMPEGGSLHIGLARASFTENNRPLPDMKAGEWISITVADTGVGIAPDVLPYIYEPFFTTKPPGQGTGLGLPQVYGIMKQHDGHIDAASKPGEGTVFTLYLPVLPARSDDAPDSDIQDLIRGSGEMILVVEDDAMTREALVESLELLNYRVLTACDGGKALVAWEQHRKDIALVLSDVVMPEMGGIALFHALKQKDRSVKIMLLTGHALDDQFEDHLENLEAQGLAAWLHKPPSLEQLSQAIKQALK